MHVRAGLDPKSSFADKMRRRMAANRRRGTREEMAERETDRLLLREVLASDADDFLRYRQHAPPQGGGACADQIFIRTSSTSCRGSFGLSLPVERCSLSVQLAAISGMSDRGSRKGFGSDMG